MIHGFAELILTARLAVARTESGVIPIFVARCETYFPNMGRLNVLVWRLSD